MAKPKSQESEEANSLSEITIIDLLAVLWRRKFLIIGITFVVAVYSVVYSVVSLVLPPEESYMPNHFTVDADMLIKNTSSSSSSLASVLGEASALAGLAGVSLSAGATNSDLAIYLCSSREFLDALIENFNLYEKFDFDPEKVKSPRSTARDMVSKMVEVSYDDKTAIFTVSSTNTDAQFAFDVVNFTVDYLEQKFLSLGVDENLLTKKNLEENIDTCFKEIVRLQQQTGEVERSVSNVYGASSMEPISMKLSMIEMELSAQQEIYKQLKVQYELLKIDMASETPVFQILSRPEIPDRKSGPSRAKFCMIRTFVAGCLSVLLSFALEFFNNLKKDETVVAKFKRQERDKGARFSLLHRTSNNKATIRLVRAHTESPAEDDERDDEGDVHKSARQPVHRAEQSKDEDGDGDDTEDDTQDDIQQQEASDTEGEEHTLDDDAEGDEGQEEASDGEVSDDVGERWGGSQDEADTQSAKQPTRIQQESAVPKQSAHVLPPPRTQPEQKITPRHAEQPARVAGSAQDSATHQLQRPQRTQLSASDRTTTVARPVEPRAPQGTGVIKHTVESKPAIKPLEARVAPPVKANPSGTQRVTLKPVPTPLKAKGDAKDAKEELAKKRGKKDDKRDDKKGDKKRGKKDKD